MISEVMRWFPVAIALGAGCARTEVVPESPVETDMVSDQAAMSVPKPGPVASSPSGSPPTTSDEQVIAGVADYWSAFVDMNDPPDPRSPRAAAVAAGDWIEVLRRTAAANWQAGRGVRHPRGPVDSVRNPAILANDGSLAVVHYCQVDDYEIYELSTGRIIDDDVIYRERQAVVERLDQGWRVTGSFALEEFEELKDCVASYS